jgi:hypothetical protein
MLILTEAASDQDACEFDQIALYLFRLLGYLTGRQDCTLMNRDKSWPVAGIPERFRLAILICIHIIMCCLSLVLIAGYKFGIVFNPAAAHVFYNPARWYDAAGVAAAFALVSIVFIFARFSFGYFVGFYFYTMVLGYLWLNRFTDLSYDHRLAGFSAAASVVAFLLPALFITSPVRQIHTLTARSFDRLLTCILLLSIAITAVGAIYDFRIIGLDSMNEYRARLNAPLILNYLLPMTSSALLPFTFAGLVANKSWWRATAVLVLLLLFYPITLNKTVLLTPFWLVAMLLLSRFFETRIVVILSLLGPLLAGLASIIVLREHGAFYFAMANFRMIAIPSVAMDVYNDFFARHDLTYFCQISILKKIVHCPYQEQLSVVMEQYKLGFFNGSLFATEGIASVGPLFAPLTAFLCGLVIALGNRLSAGLPPSFILISAAVLSQVLLNVPLTTVLLTHGMGLLFLLWYVTPRDFFEQGSIKVTAHS